MPVPGLQVPAPSQVPGELQVTVLESEQAPDWHFSSVHLLLSVSQGVPFV